MRLYSPIDLTGMIEKFDCVGLENKNCVLYIYIYIYIYIYNIYIYIYIYIYI